MSSSRRRGGFSIHIQLEVKEVPWWSVYEIGQRLTDKFDDVPEEEIATRLPSVFIAGDACHTHSPKAGQGMNVSMQDAFNLGWKLASVLRKRCPPSLLHTYSAERRAIAKELIDFDREWAALLASTHDDEGGPDPAKTQSYFVRHGRYTAGTATHYGPSHPHRRTHPSASGRRLRDRQALSFRAGHPSRRRQAGPPRPRRQSRMAAFGSSPLPARTIRPPQLRHPPACAIFSPRTGSRRSGNIRRRGEDIDAVIDVRAVFQQAHRDLAIEAMPALLLPRKGRYGLRDYEKMFCADLKSGNDIFAMRGIDREAGCMVVVRPDQYVAHVLPLDGYRAARFILRWLHAAAIRPGCASDGRNCSGLNAWSSD